MQLDQLKVLDLSRLLPGAYATQLLADLGADVVKIEDPGPGDYARDLPSGLNDLGTYFDAVNRGKRSAVINLKQTQGREAFYRLVESADIVFEQFRPGTVENLEVDFKTLQEYNSDLIYCSLSGYGQEGPYKDRVGHDLQYLGFGGFLDLNRPSSDEKPTLPAFPLADMAGGQLAAFNMIAGVLSREFGNTDDGIYIDVSMLDAVLSMGQAVVPQALSGDNPRPGETALTGMYPCYNVYETKDSRYVTVSALEQPFWENLCERLDCVDIVNKHMADDPETRTEVYERLAGIFRKKKQATWEDELGDADVVFGVVNTLEEAVESPQIRSRALIQDIESRHPRVAYPAETSTELPIQEGPAPAQGEHTTEILSEVGFDSEMLDELCEEGAIR